MSSGQIRTEMPLGHAASTVRGRRSLDVVVASVLVLVTFPVLAVTAVASAIAFRAAPFFAQERSGWHGKTFRIVKIRSLPVSTPRYTTKYELGELELPRFSRWLRRSHLDELPQLFHVLTGSMSLVGPRPEMAHGELASSEPSPRLGVRPGCTGLWQVSPHAGGLIHEAPEYDRFYVENQSVRLDVWVLWQTVRVVVFRRPAITLADIPRWALADATDAGTVREAWSSSLID